MPRSPVEAKAIWKRKKMKERKRQEAVKYLKNGHRDDGPSRQPIKIFSGI